MSITQWAELYWGANQKLVGLSLKPMPGYVPVNVRPLLQLITVTSVLMIRSGEQIRFQLT